MKKITLLLCILMTINTFSQVNLWTARNLNNIPQDDVIDYQTQVSNFSIYQLDDVQLKSTLQNAPLRFEQTNSDVILKIPYSNGKFGFFEIFETQTLHPELAIKYSGIKSFIGKSRNGNGDRLRLTITPQGIYGKIFSTQGSVYINPYTQSGKYFKVFYKEDAIFPPLVCDFEEQLEEQAEQASSSDDFNNIVDDSTFRLFRFLGSASGEYSTFHVNQAGLSNGTTTEKKAAVLAAMTVSLDRVIGITEIELSTSFQFVSQTDAFIYLDPATDPFTNQTNTVTTAQQNQALTAGNSSNFDIGHVFSTAPGGVAIVLVSQTASLGNICRDNFNNNPVFDNLKAAAVSGNNNAPIGDGFDLVLAHEMGHQMGASHTQNNPCQRTDFSAFETGSGVTIMSYAGICAPNVELNPYDHYHSASLIQMFNILDNNACGQNTSISNNPPSIVSQTNYIIPKSTPFLLEAVATDPDNDPITYNWEQYDNGISPDQPPEPTFTLGPNFRSFPPSAEPRRYFPNFNDVLNNNLTPTWEVIPSVARSMDFVVTVRDNNILGGQNAQDFVNVNIVGTAGPFSVTSQNTDNINWLPGENRTITWDVAGTTANGINTSNVNILLSTDGGLTFNNTLASNVANDGSEDITVPSVQAPLCRIMVEPVDNIYYALNSTSFAIDTIVTNTCDTYDNPNPVSIPDGTGSPGQGPVVSSVINIPDNLTNITDINVTLDVSHTYINDLLFQLQAPGGGDFINLWARNCSNEDAFTITFNDNGSSLPAPNSNCANPLTGTFAPASTNTDLNAIFSNGTSGNWTLVFLDFFNGDTGTLNSWEIEICTTTFSVEDNQINNFSIYPNPNNGSFNLSFSQAIDSNSEISVYDIQGRLIEKLDFDPNALTQRIQLNNQYQSGVYLVEVANSKGKFVNKLIIR